jgi:surface protein
MAAASLDFVHKNLNKETNYREDQKELIEKALEITNGDKLGTLQYIVSCFAHEGINIEFELEYCVNRMCISMPIIETEPKDPLGFYVSWGDGTITHNETEHIYKSEIVMNMNRDYYRIRFFGLGIKQFGQEMMLNDITEIISFGDLGHTFTSLEYACVSCYELKSVPANIPKTVTNLSNMFKDCMYFNYPLNTWDTSNVTNMSGIFNTCHNFNQQLNLWDVSKVTDMSNMFKRCFKFNQLLNEWDTSNVTNMRNMFECCNEFNQLINLWDTRKVTNMGSMFTNCKKFNQPLDKWNIDNVVDMSYMFFNCKKFDQCLDDWWKIESCQNINRTCMFVETLMIGGKWNRVKT